MNDVANVPGIGNSDETPNIQITRDTEQVERTGFAEFGQKWTTVWISMLLRKKYTCSSTCKNILGGNPPLLCSTFLPSIKTKLYIFKMLRKVIIYPVCFPLISAVLMACLLLQVGVTVSGITYGAMLGLFSLGMFFPWANTKVKVTDKSKGRKLIFGNATGYTHLHDTDRCSSYCKKTQ